MNDKRKWVPEIMYEEYEEDSISGGLPFIQVPNDKEMPDILFMFGSRETGEFEPDLEGEPQPIMEMELFQYANMHYLKQSLTAEVYDEVRVCLGLEPLAAAKKKGQEQSKKILNTNE